MKLNRRIVIALSLLAITLGARSLLLKQANVSYDDERVEIKLPSEFDPYFEQMNQLKSVHEKKRPPQPGDWMERFPEGGQPFSHYVRAQSETPLQSRYQGIDIQPLGDFDEIETKLLADAADFIERFYGVPVHVLETVPLEDVPPDCRRMRNDVEQVLTNWIMSQRLLPEQRSDAIATAGFVKCDLWPGMLNWVFGEALPAKRVAVWSMHRDGNPHEGEAAYQLCLLRTLKTSIHEIGHVLGMPHCIEYECGMNGTRSTDEHDRRQLEFCPDCQTKILWTCGTEGVRRCQRLAEFSEKHGWIRESEMFRHEESLLRERSKQ